MRAPRGRLKFKSVAPSCFSSQRGSRGPDRREPGSVPSPSSLPPDCQGNDLVEGQQAHARLGAQHRLPGGRAATPHVGWQGGIRGSARSGWSLVHWCCHRGVLCRLHARSPPSASSSVPGTQVWAGLCPVVPSLPPASTVLPCSSPQVPATWAGFVPPGPAGPCTPHFPSPAGLSFLLPSSIWPRRPPQPLCISPGHSHALMCPPPHTHTLCSAEPPFQGPLGRGATCLL